MKGRILMQTPLYTEAELQSIREQQKKRWKVLFFPCAVLLTVILFSFILRVQWLSVAATIALGVLLIAGRDLAIKPLASYERHLKNCLKSPTRECELPFLSLSEAVVVLEGVPFRELLCTDTDSRGRMYERSFYFDAQKAFPDVQAGDKLHIIHHSMTVTNVYPA